MASEEELKKLESFQVLASRLIAENPESNSSDNEEEILNIGNVKVPLTNVAPNKDQVYSYIRWRAQERSLEKAASLVGISETMARSIEATSNFLDTVSSARKEMMSNPEDIVRQMVPIALGSLHEKVLMGNLGAIQEVLKLSSTRTGSGTRSFNGSESNVNGNASDERINGIPTLTRGKINETRGSNSSERRATSEVGGIKEAAESIRRRPNNFDSQSILEEESFPDSDS